MLRRPCVAGQFYPGDNAELTRNIDSFLTGGAKERALAMITPHAGYIYSGKVAGSIFSAVEIPDNVILIGPNHTGLGSHSSVMGSGTWQMPFGEVEINEELANLVIESTPHFSEDASAHMREHSLEVQLPFLHALNPGARIVPITLMGAGFERCRAQGEALAEVIRSYEKEVLIVVSSDMNHYEDDESTRKKDHRALEKVLALDAEGLLERTSAEGITMCGAVPSTLAIVAAKILGATEARLVDYDTSATASGDYGHVVGYAGVIIK